MTKLKFFIPILIIFVLTSCWEKTRVNEETAININSWDIQKDITWSWAIEKVEKEPDLWKIYDDKEIWLSFNYPTNYELITSDDFSIEPWQTYIKIESKKIWVQNKPTDLSKVDENKNMNDLASWKYWVNYDNPYSESKKVDKIWSFFWQDFLVLSRFDICSVTLERKLLFYFFDKQIVITSYAPINILKSTMNEYFTTDKENCWNETKWIFDKQKDFYKTLVEKKAPEEIQTWYDNFDKIINTINFISNQ